MTVRAKPRRYESPAGLAVHVNANGSIRRMEHGDIVLNLFPGTEMEWRAGQPLSAAAWQPDQDATSRAAQSARAPARRRRAAATGEYPGSASPRAGARQGKPLVVVARQDGEPDGRRGHRGPRLRAGPCAWRTTAQSA